MVFVIVLYLLIDDCHSLTCWGCLGESKGISESEIIACMDLLLRLHSCTLLLFFVCSPVAVTLIMDCCDAERWCSACPVIMVPLSDRYCSLQRAGPCTSPLFALFRSCLGAPLLLRLLLLLFVVSLPLIVVLVQYREVFLDVGCFDDGIWWHWGGTIQRSV